jgi:hypothetical protein
MALAGSGLIAIWNDILPESREDFFEWHPREHMVERLGIPGFLRGRRCAALEADVEFLTLYEVQDTSVLGSDVYKTRVTNPTPWSSRVLPAFRNNVRGACQVAFSQGYSMGGFVLTLRFKAQEGSTDTLVEAVKSKLMPGLIDAPRITGAHFCVNDMSLTSGNAGVQRGRLITVPELVVIIEGSTAEGVRTAGNEFLGNERLVELGAMPDVQRGLYQLEYSLQNLAI